MSRVILFLTGLFISVLAAAQCGMAVTMSFVLSCGVVPLDVNTTGGTAPYTIVIETHQYNGGAWWYTAATVNGDADGDLHYQDFGMQLDHRDQCRVTVTDATNCIATYTSQSFIPHYWLLGYLVQATDCTNGISTIEFNASVMYETPASSWTYSLDNAPLTDFLANWTLQSSNPIPRYRLNTNVSAGSHTVAFPNVFASPWQYCGMSLGIVSPQPVSAGDCGANVSVRAALQGALPSGTLMSDSLRAHGLIPVTEPYSSLGYSYTGMSPGATSAPSLLTVTGNNAIVDWVVVELRNSANSAQVMFSRPALLQRDGDVVDLDGDGYVNFPSASGSYYVALRHRNHLGVMKAPAQTFATAPATVDFRSFGTNCFGTTPRAQVGSVYCLWAGDATGNGTIAYTGTGNDRDPILVAIGSTTPNNTLNNVYDRRDTNLDGSVKYTGSGNDRDIILTNVGSTTPTNTRTQQLP